MAVDSLRSLSVGLSNCSKIIKNVGPLDKFVTVTVERKCNGASERKARQSINPFNMLMYPYRVHAVFCNLDALCRNLKENSNNYYFMPTNKFFYYIDLM